MQMASLQQLDPELSEASVNKGGGSLRFRLCVARPVFLQALHTARPDLVLSCGLQNVPNVEADVNLFIFCSQALLWNNKWKTSGSYLVVRLPRTYLGLCGARTLLRAI